MTSMKVVVFGARGMLGQALTAVLSEADVVGVDRDEVDITDRNQVFECVRREKPDYVVNAAAYTDVDGCETHFDEALAVNAGGVKNIAEAANAGGAIVVHYSTDYVFDGQMAAGYDEAAPLGPPVNAYGASKLAGEEALASSGVPYYLLRTAWLYGSGGKNFVDTMRRVGAEKKEVRVVDDQFGSPTYTTDVARATWEIVSGEYPVGIYHTVNAGRTSWFEFAQEIFRLSGMTVKVVPVSSEEFPRPAKRPRYSVLLNTRGPQLRDWPAALGEYLAEMPAADAAARVHRADS